MVAPETRARVEAAMRELGYVPNQLAGALAERPHQFGRRAGADDREFDLRRYGAGPVRRTGAARLCRDPRAVALRRRAGGPHAGGAVVAASGSDHHGRIARDAKTARGCCGAPAFRSSRPGNFRQSRSTRSPDSTIMKPASRSRGISSRRAARISLSSAATTRARTRRWNGFKETALQAGLKTPRRLILDRNASGSVVALADLPGVDAVFAANDAHAIGFMSGLRAAGLLRNGPAAEQPVAVIGLGDLEMGRLISPSLSHHPRSWRRHRPNRRQADADARRAAPYRSRLRTRAAGQWLSFFQLSSSPAISAIEILRCENISSAASRSQSLASGSSGSCAVRRWSSTSRA